jgi:pimeloyl-ACP methyl ester carboxylesterase
VRDIQGHMPAGPHIVKSLPLKTERARLRYHDIPGTGVPLIFVHGLGCASSCDYPEVASSPALAGRRALLIDLLGSGFSDRPADFSYNTDGHARLLAEGIVGLGFETVHLFGHSMGGAIAITMATLLGARAKRLVLSEPNLDAGGGVYSRRIASLPETDYVAYGHADLVRDSRANGDESWAASLALSYPLAVHRGATSLVSGVMPSWREQLRLFPSPKTIIVGEKSLPDTDAGFGRDGVHVEIVPRAGHGMAWENPAGLAHAINRALSD